MNEHVDRFGRFIMEELRDKAIGTFDKACLGLWVSPGWQAAQERLASLDDQQREAVRSALITAVDSGLHDFLFALSQHEDDPHRIRIIVDGQDLTELSDGLHGDLFAWVPQYSKYPRVE